MTANNLQIGRDIREQKKRNKYWDNCITKVQLVLHSMLKEMTMWNKGTELGAIPNEALKARARLEEGDK